MCKHNCKHTNMHKMPPLIHHSSLLAQLCKTNTGSQRRWRTQSLLDATVEREGFVAEWFFFTLFPYCFYCWWNLCNVGKELCVNYIIHIETKYNINIFWIRVVLWLGFDCTMKTMSVSIVCVCVQHSHHIGLGSVAPCQLATDQSAEGKNPTCQSLD